MLFRSQVHQGRIGYEWKNGNFAPYIEGGGGVTIPDAGDQETFTALEVGSKFKLTDSLSAYGKWENIFQEDSTRDWKVELGTKYKFYYTYPPKSSRSKGCTRCCDRNNNRWKCWGRYTRISCSGSVGGINFKPFVRKS